MNRADTASARHYTYLLVSRLFLDGLTDDLLPYIEKIPELASVCPQSFDPEEAAVDHHQIFSFEIFPYESIFRDSSGLVGGAYTSLVQDSYQQSCFQQSIDSDHIAYELAFLAFLCSSEARALENKQVGEAIRSAQSQQRFLQHHLLCWLPPFVNALTNSGQSFYVALGRLALDLVYDHTLHLAQANSRLVEESSSIADCILPKAPNILHEKQAGLKQVSRFLITPPFSGFYVSRSSITELARNRQLPRGFGDRQQLLSNLLRAAGQYDTVPALLHDLASIANVWNQAYQQQQEYYPELESWIRPWQQRVAETANSLYRMSKMVSTVV